MHRAAPVLFDAYQLDIEQHILSEALFSLLVAGGLVVLLWRARPSLAACAVARRAARRGGAHPVGRPRADRPGARVCDRPRRPRAVARRLRRRLRSRWSATPPGTARPRRAGSRSPTTTGSSCTAAWRLRELPGPHAQPRRTPRPVRPAPARRSPEPQLLRLAPVVAALLPRIRARHGQPQRSARVLRARRDPPPAARLCAHRARRHGALRLVRPQHRPPRRGRSASGSSTSSSR